MGKYYTIYIYLHYLLADLWWAHDIDATLSDKLANRIETSQTPQHWNTSYMLTPCLPHEEAALVNYEYFYFCFLTRVQFWKQNSIVKLLTLTKRCEYFFHHRYYVSPSHDNT